VRGSGGGVCAYEYAPQVQNTTCVLPTPQPPPPPIPTLNPTPDALDPRPHDLVHQQQLARDHGRAQQDLALDAVVVVDPSGGRVQRLASGHVQPHGGAPRRLRLLLQLDERLLRVVAAVLRQDLDKAEEGLGEGLDAQLGAPLGLLLDLGAEVVGGGQLKGAGAWWGGG